MTQEDYDNLCKEYGAIQLGHPEFDAGYHKNYLKDVTVVIPQRKTKEFTRLCVESLLRFYPDIKIIIIDGDSQDDSTLYIKYKAAANPNITYYNHIGRNSHGEILHLAFSKLVKTRLAVTMDSDTIVNRGGWIEGMAQQFKENLKLYATGSLMLVSYKGECCNTPENETDICRYAHPSCSMYHIPTYHAIGQPATDHGAALALNMMKARDLKLDVGSYPIDKYVSHRMGVSWVKEHQIIWKDDYDVFIRPFISFIVTNPDLIINLKYQTDKDFNIYTNGDYVQMKVWDGRQVDINNKFFGIRNTVNGEYVCLLNEEVTDMDKSFVNNVKVAIIEEKTPDELVVGGLRVVKRKKWQAEECLS